MSEELIVKHCSPTLAGLKTGNMFSVYYSDAHKINEDIRKLNRRFASKGLRILPIRFHEHRALIYVYRPKRLCGDLHNEMASHLLEKCGYVAKTPQQCIVHLIKRMRELQDFPHEVGLFLGYPPEDVCAFIENKAQHCKCVGCWKVYGDVEKAQKTFAQYKKCTDVYMLKYAEGRTIEKLTVAG